jgi:hypothetical protein
MVPVLQGEAKQPMVLDVARSGNAGSEEQIVRVEQQAPQPLDHDWISGCVGQRSEECSRARIENIDRAIAKVSEQQIVAELAEATGCQRETPGCSGCRKVRSPREGSDQ